MIRTRVAPSPTGIIHIGTAYMSLFNYVLAKKYGGSFILRLEDTDIKRYVPGAAEMIYEGLRWLKLNYDEGPDKGGAYGPYMQSQRVDIYQAEAKKLVTQGRAYEHKGAIRFKSINVGEIGWDDLVHGKIKFSASEIGDFVLVKSDGYAAYNFAVVVDDHLMKISHIIRGEEHISNTPRQLALYEALEYEIPQMAHIPLLRNPDKSKISKRKSPVSLLEYRDVGYLPEAILNFLALLGWTHPEGKEIFSLQEMIDNFDISKFHKSAPVFDTQKLDWFNGQYLRKKSTNELIQLIKPYLDYKISDDKFIDIIPLVKERVSTLSEMADMMRFFFTRPEPQIVNVDHLQVAIKVIQDTPWTKTDIESGLLQKVKDNNWKTGDFFMSLRLAICASRVTPPLTESMLILGKDEVLTRLSNSVQALK